MKMKMILALGFLVCVGTTWVVLAHQQPGQRDSRERIYPTLFQGEHGSTHHGPHMKVEFENELVQVSRVRIAPHEKIPMHDIPSPRVQILLTDEHLRITFPNGETREESHKAGETVWLEPQKHAGENLSDSPLEFITVVPKKQ